LIFFSPFGCSAFDDPLRSISFLKTGTCDCSAIEVFISYLDSVFPPSPCFPRRSPAFPVDAETPRFSLSLIAIPPPCFIRCNRQSSTPPGGPCNGIKITSVFPFFQAQNPPCIQPLLYGSFLERVSIGSDSRFPSREPLHNVLSPPTITFSFFPLMTADHPVDSFSPPKVTLRACDNRRGLDKRRTS